MTVIPFRTPFTIAVGEGRWRIAENVYTYIERIQRQGACKKNKKDFLISNLW